MRIAHLIFGVSFSYLQVTIFSISMSEIACVLFIFLLGHDSLSYFIEKMALAEDVYIKWKQGLYFMCYKLELAIF